MIKGKMELKKYAIMILICCLIALMFISLVYAQGNETDVNLQDVPKNLARALGIPEYAGKLLTCAIFIFWLLLPTVIFVKKHIEYALILEGFLLLGFFIAVQWIEYWYMLVFALIVAGFWASKMKGVFY